MTDEQRESFKAVAEPMIKWLCENVHPHHSVIVTSSHRRMRSCWKVPVPLPPLNS